MSHRPPNLFLTESRLKHAMNALDATQDPETGELTGQLTGEQAEAVLADALTASDHAGRSRDEFVQFIFYGEAHAAALEAEANKFAEPYLKEAKKVRDGIQRMKNATLRLMQRLGMKSLEGDIHTIRAKPSPGSVLVYDEGVIPDAYLRVKQDEDLAAIKLLVESIEALYRIGIEEQIADTPPEVKTAREILRQAEKRRTAVDKVAIQKAWRANDGSDLQPVTADIVAMRAEAKMEPITTMPLIPGAAKDVTYSLEIK